VAAVAIADRIHDIAAKPHEFPVFVPKVQRNGGDFKATPDLRLFGIAVIVVRMRP
jgi:hypothetical protein